MNNEKTFGEELVRVDFNVGGSDEVHNIKTLIAQVLNIVKGIEYKNPRHAELAITNLETACMYAVKLSTTNN